MLDNIKNIIADIMDLSEAEKSAITNTTVLRDDLSLDSLMLAQLTVEIEDVYGVDIFENGNVLTVQDIMDQI